MRGFPGIVAALMAAALLAPPAGAGEPTAVAVLNFANQVQGPAGQEWDWLEKGLADLVINDLSTQAGLLLVDRERMQETLTAEGIPIRPGMDLSRLTQVFVKRFKIARLVFGSFRADGDKVTLNASMVDAYSGKLLRRVQVAGEAADVLKLQKQLSSRIIAALLGRGDVQEIAAALPVWTESLPASKLLYTAVDHFDRGEFSEAWLRARRAWRADPGYADALYWVGRLHYYMLQYAHARRYYERFVYEHAGHPRVGDAIIEYLDTFERTTDAPREIVAAYEDMLSRAPRHAWLLNVFSRVGGKTSLADWLAYQLGHFYMQNTEYARAVRLVLPTLAWDMRYYSDENDAKLTLLKAARGRALLGLGTAIPLKGHWHYGADLRWHPARPILFVRPGRTRVDLSAAVEGWWDHKDPWPYAQVIYAVPPGFAFASAEFAFTAEQAPPGEVALELLVNNAAVVQRYGKGQSACTARANLASGTVRLSPALPAACWGFSTDVRFWLRQDERDVRTTHARLSALAVELTLQPRRAEAAGAVFLDFPGGLGGSRLDGAPLHSEGGIVGGMPPGRHTLGIGRGQREVQVAPGGVVRVADDGPAGAPGPRGWSAPVFVARSTRNPVQRIATDFDHAGRPRYCQLVAGRHGRLAAMWACDDDFWIATSDDLGDSWTAPRLLPVPVNSAHTEDDPALGQTPDGRWWLMFTSDRFIPRRPVIYACWSWDLLRWSSPCVVFDYTGGRRDCEVWPNAGPLLVWGDGRLGMRASFMYMGGWTVHPAIIFYDPARRRYSYGAARLHPKGPKLWAQGWGVAKDARECLHVFCRLRPQRGEKYEDVMLYLHGPDIEALSKAVASPQAIERRLIPRDVPFGVQPLRLGGEIFLAWWHWPKYPLVLGKPLDEGGRFDVRELLRIPSPGSPPGPAVQIGDRALGFLGARGRTVVFQKLDLAQALTEELQKVVLGTRTPEK